MDCKKHVFIIGSKGIPAAYGGFETFVQTQEESKDKQIHIKTHYYSSNHRIIPNIL